MTEIKYSKTNPSSIRALFDSIAPRYDFGNAVLSGNLHRLWNRRLVSNILSSISLAQNPSNILDLCSGTGEITRRMVAKNPDSAYTLVDFSEEMLEVAKKRLKFPNISFCQADAEDLPFANDTFEAATCAYGIRNIQNRDKAFSELYRVLKVGAVVGIVELTRPAGKVMNALHALYLHTMVPLAGRAITSNEDAYKYLCKSIETFVPPEQIVKELKAAGFGQIEVKSQTFGIATLFFAKKL